jgi:hypothetical protein
MHLQICIAEEMFMSTLGVLETYRWVFFFFVESLEAHRPTSCLVYSEIFIQWRNMPLRNFATAVRFGASCNGGISLHAQWCDARAVALCQDLKSESIWVVHVPDSSHMFIWSPENVFSFLFLYFFFPPTASRHTRLPCKHGIITLVLGSYTQLSSSSSSEAG